MYAQVYIQLFFWLFKFSRVFGNSRRVDKSFDSRELLNVSSANLAEGSRASGSTFPPKKSLLSQIVLRKLSLFHFLWKKATHLPTFSFKKIITFSLSLFLYRQKKTIISSIYLKKKSNPFSFTLKKGRSLLHFSKKNSHSLRNVTPSLFCAKKK